MYTRDAPLAAAAMAVSTPMVPAPTTTTTSPGARPALVTACTATAKGSIRAPSSSESCSGSL